MSAMPYRCLFVGNPNSGKSSLFNKLTGLHQKTGNFQGVTVEKLSGTMSYLGNEIELIDLPGAFSLSGISEDKAVLSRFLMKREKTDKILFVIDGLLLERSLQFLFQISDLGVPILLILTMKDILEKKNISIEIEKLKKKLSLNIVLVNAKNGEGVEELKRALFDEKKFLVPKQLWRWDKDREVLIKKLKAKIKTDDYGSVSFILSNSLKQLSGESLQKDIPGFSLFSDEIRNYIESEFKKSKLKFTYQEELITKSIQIKKILSDVVIGASKGKGAFSSRIDSFLLHPVSGLIFFFILMGLVFQSLFNWSQIPMDWIDSSIKIIASKAVETFPKGPISGIVSDGIIGGVGSVIIFIPQIALLFLFVGIMEETGYMARASLLMDKFMGKLGLSGKSFIPLLSSAACAVPAIMGARTIENKSDRMVTILVSPLITCSARYPVYILVIGAVFPKEMLFGFINSQALALFGLFLLGMFTSMFFAFVFRRTFFKSEQSFFILELPEYKFPSFRNLFMNVYKKVKVFVFNAGTVILSISIILWFLANYPHKDTSVIHPTEYPKTQIQDTYAGKLGKIIEPVIEPLGFDWKIGISLITSFAAREVMVSTLAIIYGVEGEEDSPDLRKSMQKDINPKTKKPVWTSLSAVSLLVFFAYACQCMSTLAVVRRETNSYLWTIFLFSYMLVLAYVSSLAVYQIGKILGFG
ncbi:MAG: ferrous iron transport protein B [Leptospiraceae bacterium]|nr:ferrous iron transport protein B [Leptospiraceae bacterium]MCK6380351.1 ferrous iron transport protein B [Leptospiraceae bacterium]NUM40874.1 ferrous iron transport protein B [Leptospiraceae bacterium]